MKLIFALVAALLLLISYLTGLTYKEINVITYYFFVPFVYLALLDKIINRHWFKIIYGFGLVVFLVKVKDLGSFSEWLFDKSVLFLLSFEQIGWNYIVASVIICVILPGILFIILFHYAYGLKKIKILFNKLKNELSFKTFYHYFFYINF